MVSVVPSAWNLLYPHMRWTVGPAFIISFALKEWRTAAEVATGIRIPPHVPVDV